MKTLLVILSYFFAFLFIYVILFRKFIFRPYKFKIYVGKPGSGKSTYMSKCALRYQKKHPGKRIYSNFEINNIKNLLIFNPSDISDKYYFEPESLVLIDEPNLYWDNRSYKSMDPETLKWFRLYRHNKVNIYLFSQTYDIDKKLRKLVSDIYIIRKYLGTVSVIRRCSKNIKIADNALDAESQIVDRLDLDFFLFPGATEFCFIPKYVKYHDSFRMSNALRLIPSEGFYKQADSLIIKLVNLISDKIKTLYYRFINTKLIKKIKKKGD